MASKGLLLSLFLTPIVRDVFRSYNLVDRPGFRKVHRYPVPRVGGIAIAIAYAIALLSTPDLPDWPGYESAVWKLLPGATLIFLTGLLDDFKNLRPMVKLLFQILGACLVFWNGIRIETIGDIQLPVLLSFPLTLFWLLLSTNALNLIDGLDGLCTGVGLMATLSLFTAAMLHGHISLAFVTLPLAGALLGFLCYNFNPATVFLGDSGSLLIGFLLGCYGMIWTQKAATAIGIMVPLLSLSVPILDVSLSVLRRFLSNRPIFGADRGHIHHRLLDQGLSTRQAVMVLYLGATLAAAAAVVISAQTSRYTNLALFGFAFLIWTAIQKLKYSEFQLAGRFLLQGQLRQTLDGQMRQESLFTALERVPDRDSWWSLLVAAGTEQGWVRLQWIRAAGIDEKIFSGEPCDWSYRVFLDRQQAILIEGFCPSPDKTASKSSASPLSRHPIDLMALGEAIRKTWAEKQEQWDSTVAISAAVQPKTAISLPVPRIH
ncbi:MAG: MraY family glycosyltransferase [Bryobacteraceae bacterium]|nr:MraY family glycosyltransferase [Bryobacteraceae bacterium]